MGSVADESLAPDRPIAHIERTRERHRALGYGNLYVPAFPPESM